MAACSGPREEEADTLPWSGAGAAGCSSKQRSRRTAAAAAACRLRDIARGGAGQGRGWAGVRASAQPGFPLRLFPRWGPCAQPGSASASALWAPGAARAAFIELLSPKHMMSPCAGGGRGGWRMPCPQQVPSPGCEVSCSLTSAELRGTALTWEPRSLRGSGGQGWGSRLSSSPHPRKGASWLPGSLPWSVAALTDKPPKYNASWKRTSFRSPTPVVCQAHVRDWIGEQRGCVPAQTLQMVQWPDKVLHFPLDTNSFRIGK